MGVKKTLMNILQNKAVFAVMAVGLVISGFTIDIPIPSIVEKVFDFEIVKFAILAAIVYLGSVSIEAGLLLSIVYIMLSEKIDDKQIQKIADKTTTNDKESKELVAKAEEVKEEVKDVVQEVKDVSSVTPIESSGSLSENFASI